MHDSAIKNFCVWARRELMSEVERRCALYDISEHPENPKDAQAVGGRVLSSQERKQRSDLLQKAHDEGYDTLVEQAAYTWFNRIMAIRFMEINDRLPSHTRLLSDNDGSFKPQALVEALQVDIEGIDRAHVAQLIQSGDDEETFRYLFLVQCAELASCMPTVFSQVGSSMELLLPDGLLRAGGVIERMVEDIPEEDWLEDVEIVGWMYQYYVSERKDEYFASKRKATREDLAPATQLFTPEWIVRYLVENSLGRLWMLNHPDSTLATRMEYYIAPDGDAETDFKCIESPEDITAVDPACGSGHILVYAFDLIAAMYEEEGYSRRDIPRLILEKNLTGLEIDPRAAAMASFALTMKACEYDSRFLRRGLRPRVTVLSRIEFDENERDAIARTMKDQERLDAPFLLEQTDLLDVLSHLDEAGSLFAPTEADLGSVRAVSETVMDEAGMFGMAAAEKAQRALEELEPLTRRYDVVVANPPYMSSRNMAVWLSRWAKVRFHDGKNDLYSCFILRALELAEHNGMAALVTMQSWAFESSFIGLREHVLSFHALRSYVQLGIKAFKGIGNDVVQTCCFAISNRTASDRAVFIKLDDYKDYELKRSQFSSPNNWFEVDIQRLKHVPGMPFTAAFADQALIAAWEGCSYIEAFGKFTGSQNVTSDNERFLRYHWEVNRRSVKEDYWVPYAKGGDFRRYYGNIIYVVDWRRNARLYYKQTSSANLLDEWYWYREGITYSAVSSRGTGFRYLPKGCVFDKGGATISVEKRLVEILGLLNSKIADAIFKVLNPSINLQVRDIKAFPIKFPDDNVFAENVNKLVGIAKNDWDSLECSLDFKENPLIGRSSLLLEAVKSYRHEIKEKSKYALDLMRENDAILADAYSADLSRLPPYEQRDVPVMPCSTSDSVKSLISYAVGCIMGRYSLDKPGLVLANQGDGLSEYLQQVPEPSFAPDADGIIPLTDIEYFHDDATGLFVDFMAAAFGEEHLEENLKFVADALGGTGTPRQVIRAYFRDGFFADHCKTYSVQSAGKRPIYWLFDSGKKGGFRALFYMHRYTPDLLARLRTEYVLPQQDRYRTQIDVIDDAMTTADRREAADLRKRRKKLADQLAETVAFEEKVHHLADQMIEIDLDDGVKHNYALFQDVLAKIK